jgi:hypothetical protein
MSGIFSIGVNPLGLVDSALNWFSGERSREQAASQFEQTMAFNKEQNEINRALEATKYQRSVSDAEAAGLHPLVAAGISPGNAQTFSAPSPTARDPGRSQSSLGQAMQIRAGLEQQVLKSEVGLMKEQMTFYKEQADYFSKMAQRNDPSGDFATVERELNESRAALAIADSVSAYSRSALDQAHVDKAVVESELAILRQDTEKEYRRLAASGADVKEKEALLLAEQVVTEVARRNEVTASEALKASQEAINRHDLDIARKSGLPVHGPSGSWTDVIRSLASPFRFLGYVIDKYVSKDMDVKGSVSSWQ